MTCCALDRLLLKNKNTNYKGCFMHTDTKDGNLKPGWKKKGYMAHGTCNNYTPRGVGTSPRRHAAC